MNGLTPVSKNAFAVMAVCEKTKRDFGITVDPCGNIYKLVWAFKIDLNKAKREKYDTTKVRGQVAFDVNFPGCPHCERHLVFFCHCGAIVCCDKEYGHCPKCGWQGQLYYGASEVNLSGSGY